MAYEAMYTRVRPRTLAQLLGQEHIAETLAQAISQDRLSHAYLLVGTRGTGKTSTARILARAMNCEKVLEAQKEKRPLKTYEIPCGECPACKSMDSSPDNIEFDAASNRSVDDVQRLLSTANNVPMQSRVKTFIIDEVHMLSFEAVNSILKLIEEPPPNVAFFLATTEFNKVPQTIRSRCQILNFHLVPNETIVPYLRKLSKASEVELLPEAAKKIARLAAGSMRDAVTYFDQCYATGNKTISLRDVEKVLGLVSDADLDAIITALKTENRTMLDAALENVFRTGLSSISIAESLLVRLRDMEFEQLKIRNTSELNMLENFSEEVRKILVEMQYSGVPDVIFEMALMKLAAPKKSESADEIDGDVDELTGDSIDDVKKIISSIVNNQREHDKNLISALQSSKIVSFSNGVLVLSFSSPTIGGLLNDARMARLEVYLSQKLNRNVKVQRVLNQKDSGSTKLFN